MLMRKLEEKPVRLLKRNKIDFKKRVIVYV